MSMWKFHDSFFELKYVLVIHGYPNMASGGMHYFADPNYQSGEEWLKGLVAQRPTRCVRGVLVSSKINSPA